MTTRLAATAIALATLGLLVLLGWGVTRSGGGRGGIAVNSQLGEVPVPERPASDFALPLLDGPELTLSTRRGQVVMVDFWASWCVPCRREAPTLARVYREYRDKGVEFVGVAIWDRAEDARRYLQRYGITYPNGLDRQGLIAIDYGVTGIPEKYFITRDGLLVRKFIGPMTEARLKAILDQLLQT